MATIREVARTAGVSVSTVSRVISDHPDVSEDMRQRVRAVVDLLQYRPSALARGLKTGRAKILGLLVSDITNPFYPELLQTIEQVASQRGYTIILGTTADQRQQSLASLRIMEEYQVQGIIHASVRLDDPIVDRATGNAPPVVMVNRTTDAANASSVTVDNYEGAKLATRHLLDIGRHHLVHLAGPAWASNAVMRTAGFLDACRNAGLYAERMRIVNVGFRPQTARQAIAHLLSNDSRPDGIFAVNDSIAITAMEEIAARGLRIPDDIAVIGFDDTHLSASPFIHLSTIAHNVHEMGTQASEMLLAHIEGKSDMWPQRIVLPPHLIVRGSTSRREG